MSTRQTLRIARRRRIRTHVTGTRERRRLSVFKSNTSLYAQLIDDENGNTIIYHMVKGKSIAHAKQLGQTIILMAQKKGIKQMVFDRAGFRYHGAVKALADAIREGGITI